jgi:hypothetical protein
MDHDAHNVTEVSVFAKSAEPSIAIVQVNTAAAKMKFEITEDVAHKMCTELERFLTR